MDKKEFIFPGTILGIVLIIAVGLIITQPRDTTSLPTTGLATSTAATTTLSTGTTATIQAGTMVATTNPRSSTGVTHYYPYGTTVLGFNQVAGFKNAVSIRPVAVIADNRCPAEVFCIQAGTITLSLKVSGNGQSSLHNLYLGQTIVVAGTQITFKSADPVRHISGDPAPSAYHFTFDVEPTTK